jgi:hypothetical protein
MATLPNRRKLIQELMRRVYAGKKRGKMVIQEL